MREIPKNIEFCCKITHTTNTVHERQVFGVGGSCQRCTELSLASTAVALTLFYGLKSTLLFGPFLSWSCSCRATEQKLQRQELEASALKKERSTWSSKLQRLLSCTVLAGPLLLQPSRVQGNFTTITRKNQTFKPLQSDT